MRAIFYDTVKNHDIDFIQTCMMLFSHGSPVKAPWFFDTAVAPGVVDTRWVTGRTEHVKRQSEGTLLGRVTGPDGIADPILGLILRADFVTGQTPIVDGGFYL